MQNLDQNELLELKRKRQEKLLSENPPRRIINAINDPSNRTVDDEIKGIRRDSNIKKEQIVETYKRTPRIHITDDGNPYCDVTQQENIQAQARPQPVKVTLNNDGEFSIGSFKVSGILQIVVAVFGLIVGMVTAWINFDNTLQSNTQRIVALEEDMKAIQKSNVEIFNFLTVDYEKRLTQIERTLESSNLIGNNSYTQVIQDIERIRKEIDVIKNRAEINTADITNVIRLVDKLETRLSKNTK